MNAVVVIYTCNTHSLSLSLSLSLTVTLTLTLLLGVAYICIAVLGHSGNDLSSVRSRSIFHYHLALLFHKVDSLRPSDVNGNRDFSPDFIQHCLRSWLAAWRHQAITWTNVWHFISEVLWHSFESNFVTSAQTIVLCNEFENYMNKITTTSARDWCVKIDRIMTRTHCILHCSHQKYASTVWLKAAIFIALR